MQLAVALAGAGLALTGVIIGALLQHWFTERRSNREEMRKYSREVGSDLLEKLAELTRIERTTEFERNKKTSSQDKLTEWTSEEHRLATEIGSLHHQILDQETRLAVRPVVDFLSDPLAVNYFSKAPNWRNRTILLAAEHAIKCVATSLRGESIPRADGDDNAALVKFTYEIHGSPRQRGGTSNSRVAST